MSFIKTGTQVRIIDLQGDTVVIEKLKRIDRTKGVLNIKIL